MTIRDRDRGLKALLERLKAEAVIHVGIQSPEALDSYPSGLTVAEVAAKHEFGVDTPRRSFLRDWFDENQGELKDQVKDLARSMIKGANIKTACEAFGDRAVHSIQERMDAGISPENAPSTVARKGSDTPLEDTRKLRASITSKVEVSRG